VPTTKAAIGGDGREVENDVDGGVGENSGFESGPTDSRPEAVDERLQRLGWLVFAILAAHTGTWFAA